MITNGAQGPITHVYRIPAPVRQPVLAPPVQEPVKLPTREPVKVG